MSKVLNEPGSRNVGIIHLTDIHFSANKNSILENEELLFKALKDNFLDCSIIYILVSGDIAMSGNEKEYIIAINFLYALHESLSKRYDSTEIKFIFVPGNHDCNFDLDSQVRLNNIKNINYDTIGNDKSVFKTCLEVQNSFWDFYSYFNDIPTNKIYYQVTDSVKDKKICFHCLNTAWMSQKDENPGSLFFPVKQFDNINNKEFDLNISVFHHPLNWFTPNTSENNKNEFQDFLDNISSIQIIGHEHENQFRKTENLDNSFSQTYCISGMILQSIDNPNQSGFQTLYIDINRNTVQLKRYKWQEEMYVNYSDREIILDKKPKRIAELNNEFLHEINKINIPINFQNKEVTLSDIYVFPDLENFDSKTGDIIDDYMDSEILLKNEQSKNYIFEGDSQIGKTSLLYMLLLKFYEKGYFPIFIKGKDIKSDDIDKIILKAFRYQYNNDKLLYEKYKQLDNDKKVLLIDDIQACKLNYIIKNKALKKIFNLFYCTFITIDTKYNILPQIQSDFNDINIYTILPLGYKKSNELIEIYLSLKTPLSIVNKQEILDKTKHTFIQLRQVLGDKLIPSYPIFVLSIIQSLEFKSLNLDETSYGYCYQTLIHLALDNVGVKKNNIDTYVNFVTELAFEMFRSNETEITYETLEDFYKNYDKKFLAPSMEILRTKLINSKILKQEFNCYSFSYKYIYFFLAAKKAAEVLDTTEGKKIVEKLYKNLHKEEYANILILITHHTRNTSFIDEALLESMFTFDKVTPITLAKHSSYYKLLEDILQEIKNDVIEINRDPQEERNQLLSNQDNVNRGKNKDKEDFNINEKTIPFIRAFRLIEIIGQIVKNRKGSLEKKKIKEMLTELYNTGFRMIGYFGEIIYEFKNELLLILDEKVTDKDTIQEIESKTSKLLHLISLQVCLGVFSKLIYASGAKDKELRKMYSEVAATIDSPAAKIVSFSINSYYGELDIKKLKELANEFEDNMVAKQILKARTKAYLYSNYVDHRDKQRIAEHLKMQVLPNIGRTDREC